MSEMILDDLKKIIDTVIQESGGDTLVKVSVGGAISRGPLRCEVSSFAVGDDTATRGFVVKQAFCIRGK